MRTTAELANAVEIVTAVAEAIRELGTVPSGVLYAGLMPLLTLAQYEAVIYALKKTELVTETNHVLTWVGDIQS